MGCIFSCLAGIFQCIGDTIMAIGAAIVGCVECIIGCECTDESGELGVDRSLLAIAEFLASVADCLTCGCFRR
ncbi:hypothetical protein BJ165DRAFT_375462 [Panaeolus papilionaceus]|nr:hypothetical protein BJ165DRAFT_375462 [Panaeolus papilionaceus]